jgi:predicted SnoaL-like aldol condensation-catalyzing enzyme
VDVVGVVDTVALEGVDVDNLVVIVGVGFEKGCRLAVDHFWDAAFVELFEAVGEDGYFTFFAQMLHRHPAIFFSVVKEQVEVDIVVEGVERLGK